MAVESHHHMHLHPASYAAIASGEKVSELRIYDAKRRLLAIGDTIEFTNTAAETQKLIVHITSLDIYPSWHELYRAHQAEFVRFTEDEFAGSFPYYSPAEEAEFGVVRIGIIPD